MNSNHFLQKNKIPDELGILSRSFNKLTEKMAGILVTVTEFTTKIVEGSGRRLSGQME